MQLFVFKLKNIIMLSNLKKEMRVNANVSLFLYYFFNNAQIH